MLNGSLDTVALPDVLRLIAASGKSGLLRIDDASPSGWIFLVDGRVAFATNRNNDDPIDDLLRMEYRADYVGSADDRRIVNLTDLLENNSEAFSRFLEQMIVEVLSRMLRIDEGQFRFDVDIRSRREIPFSFGVEEVIKQSEIRAEAWARIFAILPSTSEPFRMAPRLDDTGEVVLARRDWALLASIGASSTVDTISQRLKIFEFAAAKKVAELTQRGLIEFLATGTPQASVAATALLSEVVDVVHIEMATLNEVAPTAAALAGQDNREAPVDEVSDEEEPLEGETVEVSELVEVPEDEDRPNDYGPTWLPIETGAVDGGGEEEGENQQEDDPAPLLQELHRLHEPEAAGTETSAGLGETGDDGPVDQELHEDEDLSIDDIDGGDLATRWKNLRKAKRGVHAANE
jgi:hypothetical protein